MVVGDGQVLSSTFKWKIDNYSSYSHLETSKYIRSPSFSAQSGLWYLKLHPNGDKKEAQRNISLFLFMVKHPPNAEDIQAQYALTCLDDKKKVLATHRSKKILCFTEEICWGRTNFMNKSLLVNNTNSSTLNKIIILCELVVQEANLYKTILTTNSDKVPHFKELISQFNNPKFSDVKFEVQGKDFHAHKILLAAKSTVFAAMFEHNMRESEENIVTIEDMSLTVFNELMAFIYTEEYVLNEEIVSELFEAADKYQLLELKDMCEEELCKNMNTNNVMAVLQPADMHSAECLKKEAIDFLSLHGKEIVDKPEFESIEHFNANLVKDIFRGIFSTKN